MIFVKSSCSLQAFFYSLHSNFFDSTLVLWSSNVNVRVLSFHRTLSASLDRVLATLRDNLNFHTIPWPQRSSTSPPLSTSSSTLPANNHSIKIAGNYRGSVPPDPTLFDSRTRRIEGNKGTVVFRRGPHFPAQHLSPSHPLARAREKKKRKKRKRSGVKRACAPRRKGESSAV